MMPFYPPDDRRRAFAEDPRRRAMPPGPRQNFGPPFERRRPDNPYMNNQQPPYGFPQQGQRRGLPENLNMMMNHAGKLSDGINMVRQIGAFFNLFR
ncbi:hypothetical protein [Ureibacillus chungkukjangi]